MHVYFLFMRFMTLGLALLIGITLGYYFRLYYTVGTLLSGEIPLAVAVDELEDEIGRNEAERRRKALVERAKGDSGFIASRVPFGVPFRRLMFDEQRQCGLCFEKFAVNEDIFLRECDYRHIFHRACFEELRRHGVGEQRCIACPIRGGFYYMQ